MTQGRECRQRYRVVRRAGCNRMRAKPRDDGFGLRRDVQSLTVDAAALEHAQWVVRYPPHVAIRIAGQLRVPGRSEFVALGPAPNIGDDLRGNDLLATPRALTAD